MSAQRLTDAQIATALRLHLPQAAAPGLRARVSEAVGGTPQQRAIPTFVATMFDADPMSRRRALLIAATLLLALVFASAAVAGALRLFDRSPLQDLSLDPPADVPAYVDAIGGRLRELPPMAVTTIENGTNKGRTFIDRSGAVRFEHYIGADATEPDTVRILNGGRLAELTYVDSEKVWIDQPDAISEDPRVFLLADMTPNLARGSTCTNLDDGSAAAGWQFVATEELIGRPTHHVRCEDGDLWIDIGTGMILRTRGPMVDDTGEVHQGLFRTIEVTAIDFGDQPSSLFEFEPPQGVRQMSGQEYSCSQDRSCGASPAPLYTPPPGSSPGPPTRRPASRDNGWIAYVMQPTIGGDGPSDIYLVREGVAPRLLVGGEYKHGHNSCPAFSPDGTKLAYAAAGDGPEHEWIDPAIVVISLDGDGSRVAGETRIPVGDGNGGLPCPRWSPDGGSLAYLVNDELTVTHLGGSTDVIPPPTASGPWRDFAWSPVEDVIAGIRPNGLWLIPTDGTAPTLLREAVSDFDWLGWSPDGRRLAVSTEIINQGGGFPGPIRIVRADGTEPDRELEGTTLDRVTWSPTGDQIAYSDAEGNVVIADPNGGMGSHISDLVDDPGGRGKWNFGYAFSWSPDGRRLLSVAHLDGNWSVMSIAADGDPSPVVMTEATMDLYAIHSNDVSWQPVPR